MAGEPLIGFQGRGYHTEVNTFPDRPFDSYFSGNTVQICPVGALTARPYRFRARPWDLTEMTSTYPNATGDRVSVHASRNRLLRIQGVDSDAVNHGWLADRDRFSFEAVHSPDRLTEPLVRRDGELSPASWSARPRRRRRRPAAPRSAVTGRRRWPSSAAPNSAARDQYAWAKLAKGVIGTDNVDAQLGDGLPPELVCALPRATIDDACRPGGTVADAGGAICASPSAALSSCACGGRSATATWRSWRWRRLPGASPRWPATPCGCVPATPTSSSRPCSIRRTAPPSPASPPASCVPAAALLAERPLTVLVGRTSVAESAAPHRRGRPAPARAHPQARFLPLLRRGAASGAIDAGLAPGLLPGTHHAAGRRRLVERGVGRGSPRGAGADAAGILVAAAAGRIDVLVLLGADPLADFPDRELARRALERRAHGRGCGRPRHGPRWVAPTWSCRR